MSRRCNTSIWRGRLAGESLKYRAHLSRTKGIVAMDPDTAIPLAIIASFLLFLGFEAVAPSGRQMPEIRHWRLIGFAGFASTFVIFGAAPLLIVPLLPPMALIDLNH